MFSASAQEPAFGPVLVAVIVWLAAGVASVTVLAGVASTVVTVALVAVMVFAGALVGVAVTCVGIVGVGSLPQPANRNKAGINSAASIASFLKFVLFMEQDGFGCAAINHSATSKAVQWPCWQMVLL